MKALLYDQSVHKFEKLLVIIVGTEVCNAQQTRTKSIGSYYYFCLETTAFICLVIDEAYDYTQFMHGCSMWENNVNLI